MFGSPTCVDASGIRPPQIIPAAHRNFNLSLNWFQRLNRGKHIIFIIITSLAMNSTRLFLRVRPSATSKTTTPTALLTPAHPRQTPSTHFQACSYGTRLTTEHLPKIAQPSLWTSLIPKSFRNRSPSTSSTSSPKTKEWNPASFYIIIFILIGSQAIRMIALKNEYNSYLRSTDAKIRLLKEVIGKIQRGEEVDVEKMLGTGDARVEREWDEGLFSFSGSFAGSILIGFFASFERN